MARAGPQSGGRANAPGSPVVNQVCFRVIGCDLVVRIGASHRRPALVYRHAEQNGEDVGLPEVRDAGGSWVMFPGTSEAHIMLPGL